MKLTPPLLTTLAILVLTACSDYSNRMYRYNDGVPLKPFVLKLVKTEYSNKDGKVVLKVSLEAINRSTEKNNISRNRFALRVGKSREVARDHTFLESLGIETISFGPGEDATVTIPFVLSPDSLEQKIALIVDRQKNNSGETLSLIEVKDGHPPKSPPIEGEWRTARSARWK